MDFFYVDNSKIKIDRNRITDSSRGIIISNAIASISRNLIQGGGQGLLLVRASKSKITANLFQDQAGPSISFSTETEDTVVSGNDFRNSQTFIRLGQAFRRPAKVFSKNNLVPPSGPYCPILIVGTYTGDTFMFSKNFWGDLDSSTNFEPDLSGTTGAAFCNNNYAKQARDNDNFVFKPALKPNPLKYKGDGFN